MGRVHRPAHACGSTLDAGGQQTLTFDNCIIAAGATTRLLPGTALSERVVTYEEQILTDTCPPAS